MSIFERDLHQRPANFEPLTPNTFVERAATVYPQRAAVIHGARRYTWAQCFERSRRLASALTQHGLGRDDCIALMLPNTPEMIEAHYGIPALNAVMLPLNTRLDATALAQMLAHGEAKALLCDAQYAQVLEQALALLKAQGAYQPMLLVRVNDSQDAQLAQHLGLLEGEFAAQDYEAFIAQGDAAWPWQSVQDEWQAISLAYTSGTTGQPKGVVTHHRGAYLNALSNIMVWQLPMHPVYLWTLPMFHCDGWCFPWTIAAMAGTHVCLRAVDASAMVNAVVEHDVSHFCGAPIVHALFANAPEPLKAQLQHATAKRPLKGMIAAAAPPASLLQALAQSNIEVLHVYGLTEVYGPAVVCDKQEEWASMPISEQARLNARQGVRYPLQAGVSVMNPETMQAVPADGETMGEVMFRGNITMKGYLKNPQASEAAFAGGWFHSGDLAVVYPDGYLKIKDRSKDIIISGGENISSLEIEDVLYRHPAIAACAVVSQPHVRWGETPCAFVELNHLALTEPELLAFCKEHLAGFKVPRTVIFGPLPKTSTGKIQKFELRQRIGSTQAIDV
jgi:fatty-acyl-CoA synthase